MTKLELDIGLQEELAQLSMEEIRERIKRLEDDGVLSAMMVMPGEACYSSARAGVRDVARKGTRVNISMFHEG